MVDPSKLEMNWFGMQFLHKANGTKEILQRSFPFWANTIEFAIDHAKKSNKAAKHERTYWTHLVIWASITETQAGRRENEITVKEIKL